MQNKYLKTNLWKQISETHMAHAQDPNQLSWRGTCRVDRIQNPGCRILGRESWTLNPGTRILDPESWIHHPPPQPYCHRVNWHDPTNHPNPTVCGTDIKTSRHNPPAHIKTHQGIKLKTQHKHNSTRTQELERASKSHKPECHRNGPTKTARLQERKNLGKNAIRTQECRNTRMQEDKNARIQEARMQECKGVRTQART